MTTAELLPGLHVVEERDGARRLCQAVVDGDERTLLVDAGLPDTPERTLLPFLHARGLGRKPVLLVLTHPDADHRGGAPPLRASLPRLEVWGHERDAAQLCDPERTLRERYLAFAHDGVAPGPDRIATLRARLGGRLSLDRALPGDDVLDLGGRRVELLHAPGHSPGSLVVWLPDERAALVGDAVMGRGIPNVDESLLYPPMFSPPGAYRATIERLASLAPRLLVAGHEQPRRDDAAMEFLVESRDAADLLFTLVREALDIAAWRSFADVCARVAEQYPGFDARAASSFAMTVDGALAELAEAGAATTDPGPPRRFRSRA